MGKKVISNSFTGGMNMDALPELVPNNQYTFAKNVVINSLEGNNGGLISESSSTYCTTLPIGYEIIGKASTHIGNLKQEVIILTDDTTTIIAEFSASQCQYNPLITSTCFGFKKNKPVNALIKVKDNADRILYLTDGIRPYMVINLDNLTEYNQLGNFVCNRALFTPDITKPELNAVETNGGGQTKLGMYKAYIRYVSSDLAESNIVAESESILISRLNSNSRFFTNDGGYNVAATNQASSEMYQVSNKAIQFTATNLSDTYKFAQIEIVGKIGGSGSYSFAGKSPLLPIVGGNVSWTFSGANTTETTTGDIIEDKVVLRTVKAHAQKDNRLFVVNTKEDIVLDYGEIQRAALNLTVKWTTTGTPKFTYVRTAKSTIGHTSLMRDEVIAVGIKGTLRNGKATPVFHIPGRASVNVPTGIQYTNQVQQNYVLDTTGQWDLRPLTVTALNTDAQTIANVNPYEVEHLTNHIVANTIPQWRVFNTAWCDTIAGSRYEGMMGYHEIADTYPDIDTLFGGKLYGALTGTPIRHHRLPDVQTIAHADNQNVYPLFVQVDLTPFLAVLPTTITSEVISWEIVIAERLESEKTIIDKGFTTTDECMRASNTRYAPDYGEVSDPKIIRFYSPKILFNKSNINSTNYKVEYAKSYNDMRTVNHSNIRQVAGAGGRDHVREFYDYIGILNTDIIGAKRMTNFGVQNGTYIADTTLVKEQQTHVQGIITGSTDKEAVRNYNYTPHRYSFLTTQGSAFHNPTNINYSAGNILSLPSYWTYGSLKNEHDVYRDLSEISYIEYKQNRLSNVRTTVEGDIFISPLMLNISSFVNYQDLYEGFRPTNGTLKDTIHDVYYVWVESEINCGVRHQKNTNSKADGDLYYQGWISSDGVTVNNQWIRGNLLKPGFEEHLEDMAGSENISISNSNMDTRLFKQALLYNLDFNYFRSLKNYTALANTYNYIRNNNDTTYRYRYSEKSFQDTIKDNYRSFKYNNYVTQDAQLGEPVDIFVDKNELYGRTNKTVLFLPTNTQTVKTNEASFYLGNAAVLPYDPKAVSTLNYSYGGGYDFTHRIQTEYGTVLVDIYSRKLFMLRDGLQEINGTINTFFQHYLFFDSIDYNIDSFRDRIRLYYDTRSKRLMLTVKRFNLLDTVKNRLNNNRTLTYLPNGDIFQETDLLNPLPIIPPHIATNIFSEENYTISFSYINNAWVGFHDYFPLYAWESNNGFIEQTGRNLYKHEDNHTYLSFDNGVTYSPMIVEYIVNEPKELQKLLSSLHIKSEHIEWDFIDCFTTNQHTGHQAITAIRKGMNATLNQMYGVNISEFEGYFRIDRLIDRVNDATLPIWQINNLIEKVVDNTNINTQNKMVNSSLRSNAIRVRLEYRTDGVNNKRQSLWAVLSTVDLMQR